MEEAAAVIDESAAVAGAVAAPTRTSMPSVVTWNTLTLVKVLQVCCGGNIDTCLLRKAFD